MRRAGCPTPTRSYCLQHARCASPPSARVPSGDGCGVVAQCESFGPEPILRTHLNMLHKESDRPASAHQSRDDRRALVAVDPLRAHAVRISECDPLERLPSCAIQENRVVAQEHLTSRRIPMRVLRHHTTTADGGPHHSPFARRRRYLGEPCLCVQTVQQSQRQSHAGRSEHAPADTSSQTASRDVLETLRGQDRRDVATVPIHGLITA